ncbi:hypothetical protein [Mucilaginibacter gracilis]|nr:hypothetical protein [Mucilaginibacter gracilis]
MKPLFILSLFISGALCHAQAQSSRWMLYSKSPGYTYKIDTLYSDIKQYNKYDDHYSVVILWCSTIKETHSKNIHHVSEYRYKMAIDTANLQYEIKSAIEYLDKEVVHSEVFDGINWQEIIPDTIA